MERVGIEVKLYDMALLGYLVLALVAAASAAPESRIVGGTPTTIEEFPYIVALVYTYTGPGITVQRCVGCLLSSWHVLTSGFCYTGAINENMKVRAGSTTSLTGGTLVGLGQVIKHEDYAETPRRADIAVTFLQAPLSMSNVIGVLYLPPQGTYIPDGHPVEVVSWGFEYEGGPQLELLKTITLNKVNTDVCATMYTGNTNAAITDNVICANAAGKGMCAGDSGAPMVIGQVVVGISSYFAECGSDVYPDVFTRIDRYTDWILGVATAPSSANDVVGLRSAPVRL